jgi:DNA repair exonuclease SbcCD nuclease subunit
MNILILGDPHFKRDNVTHMEKINKEILDLIINIKPNIVVSLGDTLDTHDRVHQMPANCAYKFYFEISKLVPLYVIVGNHDRINNSDYLTDMSSLYPLSNTPNITIVTKPLRVGDILYVPYVYPGKFTETVIDHLDNCKLIFAHQEFTGAKFSIKPSTVEDWEYNIPIISGHIHEYQVINNITYVGTYLQQTYAENSDKALLYIEMDADSNITLTKRIKLNSTPKKKIVHINYNDMSNYVHNQDYLVKAIIHLDTTQKHALVNNTHYINIKKCVDLIELKITDSHVTIDTPTCVNIHDIVKTLITEDQHKLYIKYVAN